MILYGISDKEGISLSFLYGVQYLSNTIISDLKKKTYYKYSQTVLGLHCADKKTKEHTHRCVFNIDLVIEQNFKHKKMQRNKTFIDTVNLNVS